MNNFLKMEAKPPMQSAESEEDGDDDEDEESESKPSSRKKPFANPTTGVYLVFGNGTELSVGAESAKEVSELLDLGMAKLLQFYNLTQPQKEGRKEVG